MGFQRRQKLPQGQIHCFFIPRPHQWLLLGVQACRLPRLKRFKALLQIVTSQALNASKASNRYVHQWLLMGFQRRQKLPLGQIQGLRNCYMARFGQALKASKAPQQLSKALAPHKPPLALPSYLPRGPTNCFYWASKLLHGTFWPGLKSLKSPAAAFESLSTAQPSACFAIVPPHRPYTNCFYWASKLLHGTFWAGLKTFTSPTAAFESLSTAQPSACFAIVPPHRPYKLFLLGFETATWHVLARP